MAHFPLFVDSDQEKEVTNTSLTDQPVKDSCLAFLQTAGTLTWETGLSGTGFGEDAAARDVATKADTLSSLRLAAGETVDAAFWAKADLTVVTVEYGVTWSLICWQS